MYIQSGTGFALSTSVRKNEQSRMTKNYRVHKVEISLCVVVYLRMSGCVYTCAHVLTRVCMSLCVNVRMCTCIRMCACIYA